MKKIIASLAVGLILASAVPALAADSNAADNAGCPYGHCWRTADGAPAGDGSGPHGRRGHHRGYCWNNDSNNGN